MMRILLTGIRGQVGGALHQPLSSLGEVVAVDRSALDLSHPKSIQPFLESARPDFIVNPAAYTAVDQAEDESELAYRVNAEAPHAMAKWAAVHDVPILHFSTDYVFDGSGTQPWRETDPTDPLSVYGASKLAGEHSVRGENGCHAIVRTCWVYASTGRNFLTTMVRLAQERAELRVVADQVGAPTSAAAIADGVMSMLKPRRDESAQSMVRARLSETGGLLHMCAAGETSWHGFARAIVEELRTMGAQLSARDVVPIQSSEFPTKVRRPKNSRLSNDRLHELFGFEMRHWRDDLTRELSKTRPPAIK